MNTALHPVTRLCKLTYHPPRAKSFTVVHDLDPAAMEPMAARWCAKTKRPTAASLIEYIKGKKPHCICVTLADYEEITRGKVVPATKEEYEAENPA